MKKILNHCFRGIKIHIVEQHITQHFSVISAFHCLMNWGVVPIHILVAGNYETLFSFSCLPFSLHISNKYFKTLRNLSQFQHNPNLWIKVQVYPVRSYPTIGGSAHLNSQFLESSLFKDASVITWPM